ncbi:MAG: EAL domain-containing protein [Austwickia sp.]|nr:EAL domain-containing protein [Austwickia sp.]
MHDLSPDHGSSEAGAAALLRRELDTGDLVAVYQPFINTETGAVQGYEAFIRRKAALHEGAASFLNPVAMLDLICDIDEWILQTSLRQLSTWRFQSASATTLMMSVNLAERHVAHPHVVDSVGLALKLSGIPPDRLMLDVHPSVLTEPTSITNIKALRRQSVCICLDSLDSDDTRGLDFRGLVDIVKLNPKWLDDTRTTTDVLEGMVAQAQAAGLPVVAGGIETQAQLLKAQELGCEWVQGFYFGAPSPAPYITAEGGWMRE